MTPAAGAGRVGIEDADDPTSHVRSRRAGWPPLGSRRPAIACLLLSQWGIAVGTVVGWQASQSMMGLPTATFFMMMMKMMWFRDVVGLVVKGLLFGALPATICCYEGLGPGLPTTNRPGTASARRTRPMGWPLPGAIRCFGPLACRAWPF